MALVRRGIPLAAAVVLAALLDLWIAVRPNPAELSPEAMRAASAAIAKVQKTGDLVVFSPLLRMSELAALGTELRASPHLPPRKLLTSRRVVLLDREDHPMHGFAALGDPKERVELPEGLELSVYEPAGPIDVVAFDLKESLAPGTLRIERPQGVVSSKCTQPRDEGGWSCPGEAEWLYAQTKPLRIEGQDTPCIWAHPTTGGVVVFEVPPQPPAPAGRRLQLVLSAALTDDAVKMTPDGAPVTTSIVQTGRERGRVMVPNRIGWQRTTVNIDAGAPVELRILTPRDGRRHHCINAQVIDVPESATNPPSKKVPGAESGGSP